MAKRSECVACGGKIPAGMAVLRSVDFELVAFHKVCFESRVFVSGGREMVTA